MKRMIAVFLAITTANFAMAHGSHGSGGGDGSGLSVGLEFGLDIDVAEDEDAEVVPNTSLILSYSEGFLDDALDFDISLSYIFSHKKGAFEFGEIELIDPGYGDDFYQQILCLEAGLSYTLDLDYFTTLSFSLENETDFYLAPRLDDENNIEGVLTPGIALNWDLSFGSISVGYEVPLQYVSYFKEEEFGVGSDIGISWQSKFGLGIGFTVCFSLTEEAGFEEVEAVISYELPVKDFTFYVNCNFEGIGSEEGLCIMPAIGVKYTF